MNQPDPIVCRQARELLLPTLPGSDAVLPAVVVDHLTRCDACADELARRQAMATVLRELPRSRPGSGLHSFAQVREEFEAREEPTLERAELRWRPLLGRLRRVPAPASLTSRVLPERHSTRLRLLRRVGSLAAAAGLLAMGLLSLDRSEDVRDRLAQGRPLAPVVEIVHVDTLDQAPGPQRATIEQRLIPWSPSLSGKEAR